MPEVQRLRAGQGSCLPFPLQAIHRKRTRCMVPQFDEITRLMEMLVPCPLAGPLR